MTINDIETEIVISSSLPNRGYDIGQLLWHKTAKYMYELTAKNPHVWTKIINPDVVHKSPIYQKYGRYEANGNTIFGEGLMHDIQGLGDSFLYNGMDATGTNQTQQTGSSVIQNAGLAILRTGLTRSDFLPYYLMKTVLAAHDDGGTRFYSGWNGDLVNSFLIGETPIDNVNGGIVVCFNAADSDFAVWHSNGDGTTPVDKVPMTNITKLSGFGVYSTEIKYISLTNVVVTVYGSNGQVLDTKTLTTNLPPHSKKFSWSHVIQNPTQLSKNITNYGGNMAAIK